jgi:hypothetical protein
VADFMTNWSRIAAVQWNGTRTVRTLRSKDAANAILHLAPEPTGERLSRVQSGRRKSVCSADLAEKTRASVRLKIHQTALPSAHDARLDWHVNEDAPIPALLPER